jgi:hypothetical protein
MQTLELTSYPLDQRRDLDAVEMGVGQWCAEHHFPMRLLAYNRRCNLRAARRRIRFKYAERHAMLVAAQPLLQAIADRARGVDVDPAEIVAGMPGETRALLARMVDADFSLPQLHNLGDSHDANLDGWLAIAEALRTATWQVPWLHELERFYETLENKFARSAEYLLLTWEGPEVTPESLRATLQLATGCSVTLRDQLPNVVQCAYQPKGHYLQPRQPGEPYLATLLSYDVQGTWSAYTLHSLMATNFDLAIAVDIHTVPRARAMRRAELAFAGTRAQISDPGIKDAAAERRNSAAELLLHELMEQGLHEVQIAVLVSGETLQKLEDHVEEVKMRVSSSMKLTHVTSPEVQRETLKYWSIAPSAAIDAPSFRRNMLSQGVGCCWGLVGYHRPEPGEGIFWGLDAQRAAPLFFDLFKGNQAAHQVIVGKSGYGKTLFLNTIASRAAAEGYQVIGFDAFKNGDRVARAIPDGARCYSLGLDTPMNPLDVAHYDEPNELPGTWKIKQNQHVIGLLAQVLSTPSLTRDEKFSYAPRVFLPEERGLLDVALRTTYARFNVTPETPLDALPLLSDFLLDLEALGEPESTYIARQLRFVLFGSSNPQYTTLSPRGRAYNSHTQVDLNFRDDITYFDLERLPQQDRPPFYGTILGAFRRWMRSPFRDRRRPTLLQMDEFGYASQVAEVGQLAAEICKTARKYKVGIMLIDQNPQTFLDDPTGRQIWENAAATIAFHLEDVAARQLGAANSALTPEHVRFLTQAKVGEYVATVRNEVFVVSNQVSAKELEAFGGS